MKLLKRILQSYQRSCICIAVVIGIALISLPAQAQQKDSLSVNMNLEECIAYAINHQPYVQQAKIDEVITDRTIKYNLSAWYPQANLGYNIQHYLKMPTPTSPYMFRSNSTTTVSVTQNIFNSSVLLASKTATDTRLNASQNTELTKIAMVVGVSKAYYNVLITRKQIVVLNDDILELQKSLKDALAQYQAGVVDKTDYQRATIMLNNAFAAKKQYEEQFKSSFAFLKQQMGYNGREDLVVDYDDQKLKDEINLETIGPPSYQNRVEFQQLKTMQRILNYNLKYAKWSYLPTVSLFGIFNAIGQNKVFSKVYAAEYPNSLVGLTLNVPIFQGSARVQQVKLAELKLNQLEYEFQNLKSDIDTGYISALGTYKASLNEYNVTKDNLTLTREVYNTIHLQYISGTNSYLNVVIAYTDLRTAEVTSLNALYQVLSSKLDVEQAAGTIKF
jgi:outer membrane protein